MQFETKQGQLLFHIHFLYKTNQLTEQERGYLKDLIISSDQTILQINEQNPQQALLRLIVRSQKPQLKLRPKSLIFNFQN